MESGTNGAAQTETEFKAPYIPFRRVINLADRMLDEGTPGRIDRGYLSNLSGTDQSYLIATVKALGLMGEQGELTPLMERLVSRETRREAVVEILNARYGRALNVGSNATQDQLLDVFREHYGVSGETARKAASFYLQAAQFAEIPLSPHFKVAKTSSGATSNGTRARTRQRKITPRRTSPETASPPTSMESLRTRYIDMLLKKADTEDAMDENLLNRIEGLLGFDTGGPSDEDNDDLQDD